MPFNITRARERLQDFDFQTLFVQELGWDKHAGNLSVAVDGKTYSLQAIAEKRGFQVFVCPTPDSAEVPDYPTRSKIERQVAKSAHEHIIIYTDTSKTVQKWQWVWRELGYSLVRREYDFFKGQTGEVLIQKLPYLYVDLSEEEKLTLVEVLRRARDAFNVDRITKRFYDRFQGEHATFLNFIKGIMAVSDREWYASLMLNRLMFVYFIQKKGFLDGDPDYLRNRLKMVQQHKGKDKFLTFYRYFLVRLFHEGLGQPPALRKKDLEDLLGDVPYLNGGLFEVHELEEAYPNIQIADDAFERLFDFFDAYQWHLDNRPARPDNEINPDVLGYIFEKYINQKQMGAYYTKEDITGYIARNTIIPFLFGAAEKKCAIAFKSDGALWRLLREDPDRYIYPAVRRGVDMPLPPDIAIGINDVSKRGGWNRLAPAEYALPTETWREHVARRQRCQELRTKLRAGEIHGITALITYNLDICQFAEDVIENSEGPELLRAFYHAIENVSVLDPACGSGAFLFAALSVLEPLCEACLDRMEGFLGDLQRSGGKYHPEKFSDFRHILDEVAQHPSRRYSVLKSIIIGNLYGVDIMEEAVEICKLRLFLKLVAQVEDVKQLEPLPDIDFNIRPGNTLVGFASLDEVKKRFEGSLRFEQQQVNRIIEEAHIVDAAFRKFREMQTKYGMDAGAFSEAKGRLRRRLNGLRDELDHYLAGQYGVDSERSRSFQRWRASHQPFHWLAEFYGIMNGGGFDVIVGNPPYVVYSPGKVPYTILERSYQTFKAKNLYAYFYERSLCLGKPSAYVGFIVQLTALSSERLDSFQDLVFERGQVYGIAFPRRPESIFDGVEMPVSIVVSVKSTERVFHTSRVSRFYTEERPVALANVCLVSHGIRRNGHRVAKIGTAQEVGIYHKVQDHKSSLDSLTETTSAKHIIYYQEACRYWVKACVGTPFFKRNGQRISPPHGRTLAFGSKEAACFAACLANSSLFYWFYSAFADCEHINDALLREFPIPKEWHGANWTLLYSKLSDDLQAKAARKVIKTKQGHTIEYDEMKALLSKDLIDNIDRMLAKHYGFTNEESDFIINYDIKYRMGQGAEGEDD